MSGAIRVELSGDRVSRAEQTELMRMSRSYGSEFKWRKMGRDRVGRSDQGG